MTTRLTFFLSLFLAVTALATGCASAPTAGTAPASSLNPDCGKLGAEIDRIEEARRTALEQEKDAWKAVIPFAVAARYVGGKSAAAKANQRLDELNTDFSRQGCVGGGT